MSSDPFFSESLARAVCYVMSENLLSVLPQLDDYTCPVCASITFKPGISLNGRALMCQYDWNVVMYSAFVV